MIMTERPKIPINRAIIGSEQHYNLIKFGRSSDFIGRAIIRCIEATHVMVERTTLSVTGEVRDEVRSLKTGGETYSELLKRLMEHYDPDEAHC